MNVDASSSDSSDEEETIRDFDKEAKSILSEGILPTKSANRYELVYETFMKWRETNKADSFEENIFICYFKDLQKRVSPPTCWSVWSMLKTTINLKHSIDIQKYLNLKAILKNNCKGYKPKKSLTLSWEQMKKFLDTADDYVYLGIKTLLIFGVCGALRCSELVNMKYTHVQDKNDNFIVSVEDTKTYLDRNFVIGPLFYPIVKKYISLRHPDEFTDRLFIQYINGKCHRQVMGKNKIGSTPTAIATFLKLDNPSAYTGHCFRRSSATLLSNSGASMPLLKQLGGWKSDTVAAGYVANSMKTKSVIYEGIIHEHKIDKKINDLIATPSTSKMNSSNNKENVIDEVADLNLRYEDFRDPPPDLSNNLQVIQDKSVSFTNGKGSVLPSVPLQTNSNQNNLHRTLFTQKPPVKLSFIQPNKKMKIDESNSNSSVTGNNDNNNMKHKQDKNSKIVFEHCTINGNIINNYYYHVSDEPKEN